MSTTMIYQQQHDFFQYKRLSFRALLQRPSLIGRKLSLKAKKPQLTVVIPSQRMNTSASSSTIEESPITPTSSLYEDKHYQAPDQETTLEEAVTQGASLKDFSGKGYSNFYIKLPNGNWMVRVRDGQRKIVGTFEIDGSMI